MDFDPKRSINKLSAKQIEAIKEPGRYSGQRRRRRRPPRNHDDARRYQPAFPRKRNAEETAALVRRHHKLIEKVAQALLVHETLGAEAINAIVEHHHSALRERLRVARQADREAMAWQFSE